MKLKAVLLLVLLLCPAHVRADERWYVFSIGETPVGYVVEETVGTRTRTTVFARLTRLGKSIELKFDTTVTEDSAGQVQGVSYEALLSKQATRVDARVEGKRIRIGTPPQERFVDVGDATVLGPLAVARLTAARLRSVGDAVDFAMFSPEFQRVVKVRRRVVSIADRIACGDAQATKVEETIEGLPTPRTLWLDAAALLIADTVAGPFGPMSTCRATREAALAAHGVLPADLYEKTLARSNVRLADAAAVDRIVLRVRPRDTSGALPDFSAHNQRIIEPGLIEIRRPPRVGPGPSSPAPPVGREYLDPNVLVESANPEIVKIAREQARPQAYETALALTRWTAENMTMDAGIVMAPASELIRDRKGTCMGYATLLAALSRAAGLPSRVVMGYVYYGGIWGGHAWTEMFVDSRWLPFDAAVYAPTIASATRLGVGSSSLADGGGSLTGPLTLLFGRVDVETVEYEMNGRVTRANPNEPPFTIAQGTYRNPGLRLRIRADGWTIERADSTWPSTLVVAFRKDGTTVELHQRPRYPERPLDRAGDAMFVSLDGSTLWLWIAKGPDAAAALLAFLPKAERVE